MMILRIEVDEVSLRIRHIPGTITLKMKGFVFSLTIKKFLSLIQLQYA